MSDTFEARRAKALETPLRRYLLFAYGAVNYSGGWHHLVLDFDRLEDAQIVGSRMHDAGLTAECGNTADYMHIVDLAFGTILYTHDEKAGWEFEGTEEKED